MRLPTPLLGCAASILLVASAAVADTGFFATINGTQEVPPNASPATGSGTFVLNAAQTSLSYFISYSGLTATRTAAHFHAPAAPGANAGVVRTLAGAGPTADTFIGNWTSLDAQPLTATQVSYLLGGLTYVNIHSTNFPGGEIRGQVYMDATPNHSTTWGRIKSLYR